MANKKKPFYSKKTLLLFRLFSVMGVVILLISANTAGVFPCKETLLLLST